MGSGDDVIGVFVGIVAVNIAFLFMTVVFALIIDVATVDLFTDPFGSVISTAITAWVSIGVIIGVADVLAVLGVVSSVAGGISF